MTAPTPQWSAPDLVEPVVGFRQWRLAGSTLSSLFSDVRWPRTELRARCGLGGHDPASAPAKACSCGIYAYYDPCPRTASAATPDFIGGVVVLWGRVELHEPACGPSTRASSRSSCLYPSPACANRDTALRKNARNLLATLTATAGAIAENFPSSPGMCFPHFELVWASGGTPQVRELIRDVQRRAVDDVLGDLREYIRKEGAELKHEPRGSEQDAWRRALLLAEGWPAPKESASVPEARSARAR